MIPSFDKESLEDRPIRQVLWSKVVRLEPTQSNIEICAKLFHWVFDSVLYGLLDHFDSIAKSHI